MLRPRRMRRALEEHASLAAQGRETRGSLLVVAGVVRRQRRPRKQCPPDLYGSLPRAETREEARRGWALRSPDKTRAAARFSQLTQRFCQSFLFGGRVEGPSPG